MSSSCRQVCIAMALLIAGCTVGPQYSPPKTEMPGQWAGQDQGGITAQPVEVVAWWQLMHDPALESLIQRAVQSNYDLRLAQARVREARAQRGVVAADRYPNVDVNGSYSHTRDSANTAFGGVGGAGGTGSGGTAFRDREFDLYQTGFDASWELDFFGRVRRSVEAAEADIEAANENRRNTLVTLLAEVARNYVDLRGSQRRLAIALNNIESQRQTLELSQARFKAGLVSELDVAEARAQLATTHSQVPLLESSVHQTIHALGLLLGQTPESLLSELSEPVAIPIAPPQLPVGLPSDLLRRRPDVRSAERQLAAATARIGVATADLFPRFSLTGSLGLAAEDFSNLFSASSRTYSIGPSVTWPIFDAGRIRGNIAVQNARQEQALDRYEQSVLQSLTDVENSLVAFWKEQTRRQALSEAVDANRRAVELANELYSRGLGDFLRVLESQRSLYLSEDQLVQSDRDLAANYIAVYKALGGGWEAFEPVNETVAAAERK